MSNFPTIFIICFVFFTITHLFVDQKNLQPNKLFQVAENTDNASSSSNFIDDSTRGAN